MASKLVSMKIDPKAREEKYAETAVAPERPVYPYGLQLHLDNEALEKLGLELPKVGKSMLLLARVDVTSVSENEHSYNGKRETNRSASLQITDLCLEADSGEGGSAADKLYGKGE